MAGKIHTDSEALYAIRNAIVRFADDFQNSQSNFINCFERLNDQTNDYQRNLEAKFESASDEKRKIENQLEELEEQEAIVDGQIRQLNEGKTDSFACDTCPTRMMLKVMGDTTPCKSSSGCNGTMHRVYNNSEHQKYRLAKEEIKKKKTYCLQQIELLEKQIDNLETEKIEIGSLCREFHQQQDSIIALMNTTEGVDTDSVIDFIDKAIMNLSDYQSITFDMDVETEKKKTR